VNSLVTDIITPVLSLALGRVEFQNLFVPLAGQTDRTLEEARKHGAVVAYGAFVNNVIEFFIVAFAIFLIVRQINRMRNTPAKA